MKKSRTYKIASIPGDGIGPEVVDAALTVLKVLTKTLGTFDLDVVHIPWGSNYYKTTGKYVDSNVLEIMRGFDAALFGAVGAPGSFLSQVSSIIADTKTPPRCPRSHILVGSSPCPQRTPSTLCER